VPDSRILAFFWSHRLSTMSEVKTMFKAEGLESCKTGGIATYTLLSEDESGQPKDVEMKHLKAWLKGPSDFDGKIKRVLVGQYSIEFKPEDPGHYWLDVQVDSQPIFQRDDITLQVSMNSPRNRQKLGFMFEGDGFASARVGEQTEFRIITKDDDDRHVDIDILGLEVRVTGPASYNEKAKVHNDGNGKYVARYSVSIPGDYNVSVRYDDRQVANQKVHFSDVTRGEKSVVMNAPSGNVRAREEIKVRIQSKDMFGNDVKCGGDVWQAICTGTGTAHIQITDQLNGQYAADLTFPRPGVYHVEFKLHGTSAQNSPVKFTAL